MKNYKLKLAIEILKLICLAAILVLLIVALAK
jgi:hypothetical protein